MGLAAQGSKRGQEQERMGSYQRLEDSLFLWRTNWTLRLTLRVLSDSVKRTVRTYAMARLPKCLSLRWRVCGGHLENAVSPLYLDIRGDLRMARRLRIIDCPKGGRIPEGYCIDSCLNHIGKARKRQPLLPRLKKAFRDAGKSLLQIYREDIAERKRTCSCKPV